MDGGNKGKHFHCPRNSELKHRLCLIRSPFLPPPPLPNTLSLPSLTTQMLAKASSTSSARRRLLPLHSTFQQRTNPFNNNFSIFMYWFYTNRILVGSLQRRRLASTTTSALVIILYRPPLWTHFRHPVSVVVIPLS